MTTQAGRFSKPEYLLLLLLLLLCSPVSLAANRALLISIADYQDPCIRDLPGVEEDMQRMQQITGLLGFSASEMQMLRNQQATLEAVQKGLQHWLKEGVGKDDKVLLYFSGHGTQVPDKNADEGKDGQDEALVLYDSDIPLSADCQSVENTEKKPARLLLDDQFEQWLQALPSQHVTLIMDACHSGSMARSAFNSQVLGNLQMQDKYMPWPGNVGLSKDVIAIRKPAPIRNYLTFSAAADNERAIVTNKGSLFTLGLLKTLQAAAKAARIAPRFMQQQVLHYLQRMLPASRYFHPQLEGSAERLSQDIVLVSGKKRHFTAQKLLQSLYEQFPHSFALDVRFNQSAWLVQKDSLQMAIEIPQDGYINIVSINARDEGTVLFPNRYVKDSAVKKGTFCLSDTKNLPFRLIPEAPGEDYVGIFFSTQKRNLYEEGINLQKMFAEYLPSSKSWGVAASTPEKPVSVQAMHLQKNHICAPDDGSCLENRTRGTVLCH